MKAICCDSRTLRQGFGRLVRSARQCHQSTERLDQLDIEQVLRSSPVLSDWMEQRSVALEDLLVSDALVRLGQLALNRWQLWRLLEMSCLHCQTLPIAGSHVALAFEIEQLAYPPACSPWPSARCVTQIFLARSHRALDLDLMRMLA